ncbi:hypothetical protein FFLO_05685 [Filobasidium floriforme]|uniref:ENTH domain-containing protein n=1 Tax=Filobasidium floriforme TaxID=5210 RepID=A0A8K0NL91_9TREE|nr:uncharacterized protein HD553DRAFT_360718 [Filobasidium floriforme]KAG7529413.1 hypothetical protein FFLO_05685 [Filobasidium floriforme]KAH8089744.1 hypothetical protein HD553DRAFT_360718 [Filobasidium floriforme]
MGLPWSHWNSAPVPEPRPQTDPLDSATFYHPAMLKRVVKDYVEEATNYSPDFAGEEQLQAIAQYCQAPELLEIVLDVLSERMKCAWPWNIKSLDILHYLLQSGLHLPRTQPRSRTILSTLQNLSQNPTNDPEGTAGYVKGKAGECLVSAGHLPGSTSMNGLNGWAGLNGAASGSRSGGSDGFWGFGWGRNKDREWEREKEKEKERERQLAAEQLKKQKEWMAYQQKLEQEAAAAASASAWKGLDRPKGWKIGSTSKVGGKAPAAANPFEWKEPAGTSAWVTPLKDGRGFSFSTTTVTEGPPSADHFQQHQTNHASLLEETLKKRR